MIKSFDFKVNNQNLRRKFKNLFLISKKIFLKGLIKVLIIFTLFASSYYLFFLRPSIENQKRISEIKNELEKHTNYLVQNRIAYLQLTKLSPKSRHFQEEVTSLIDILQKTQKQGIEFIEQKSSPLEINSKYEISNILKQTKDFYNEQEKLMKKALSTMSYKEGLEILKSDESLELLTKQTNLILEYEFLLNKLEELKN